MGGRDVTCDFPDAANRTFLTRFYDDVCFFHGHPFIRVGLAVFSSYRGPWGRLLEGLFDRHQKN